MAKRRKHVITLVYSVQRPPCTCFRNETSDIANGNLKTRATLNFAQTRPHCEAVFASSRCRWTRKPLRNLCTQTVSRVQTGSARFNDRLLNWQTRPLMKQISTFLVVYGRRKHSAICGQKQGRRKQQSFVWLTEQRWSCRQGRTGKVTFKRSPCPAHMLGAFELQTKCLTMD